MRVEQRVRGHGSGSGETGAGRQGQPAQEIVRGDGALAGPLHLHQAHRARAARYGQRRCVKHFARRTVPLGQRRTQHLDRKSVV